MLAIHIPPTRRAQNLHTIATRAQQERAEDIDEEVQRRSPVLRGGAVTAVDDAEDGVAVVVVVEGVEGEDDGEDYVEGEDGEGEVAADCDAAFPFLWVFGAVSVDEGFEGAGGILEEVSEAGGDETGL